jgi:hypothetical protein
MRRYLYQEKRNALIHYKSSSPPPKLEDTIAYYENLSQRDAKLLITAREAVELLDLIPGEIRMVYDEEYIWAHGYLAAESDNLFILPEDL